jgi:hypothetical protein
MAVPYVKSDKLKALAIASAQPSPLHPGLPTVAATLPGYEAASMFVAFATVKTPAVIISRLNLLVATNRTLNALLRSLSSKCENDLFVLHLTLCHMSYGVSSH